MAATANRRAGGTESELMLIGEVESRFRLVNYRDRNHIHTEIDYNLIYN